MYRKIKISLFIGISICFALPCSAQLSADIGLFEDFDEQDHYQEDKANSAPTSLVLAPPQNTQQESEPQFGRNKPQKDTIVLPTPPPFPDFPINLTPSAPEPEKPSRTNTRTESISLPPDGSSSDTRTKIIANFHNVRGFELFSFSLGMTPDEVLQTALQKGYRVIRVKKGIPLFQTSHYDTVCRQSGLYDPYAIRSCIQQYAQESQQLYVKEIYLENKGNRESFQFYFTSPATDNELYQITYQNKGNSSLNFTRSNLAKKLDRQKAFLNALVNTYGNPDDSKKIIWGSEESAFMQAGMFGSNYDAFIVLKDVSLFNEDYFAATDWKEEQDTAYHFNFVE